MHRRVLSQLAALATLVLLCASPRLTSASLVGRWAFDGCAAVDSSGNGHPLTVHGGAACVSGAQGDAWLLDGSTQYLDQTAQSPFEPGIRPWSVSAWVKTSASTGSYAVVAWYRCGANPDCNSVDAATYSLWVSEGHAYWNMRDDGAGDYFLLDSGAAIADGQWHHLVGTLTTARDSMKLYVDGALRATRAALVGSLRGGSIPVPLEVGRWFRTGWDVPGYYLPGAVDEVRIYDEELSPAAVLQLFQQGGTVGVPWARSHGPWIDASTPNPVRGAAVRVAFGLAEQGEARLDLLDIAGRRVASLDVAASGGFRQEVELARGGDVPPGVYRVRLVQGGRSVARAITILR